MTAIAQHRRVQPPLPRAATAFPGTPPAHADTAHADNAHCVRQQQGGILATVGLSVTENVLRVAQPLVIGLAINDLHRGSFVGLLLVLAQQLMQVLAGTGRRMATCRLAADLHPGPRERAAAPSGQVRLRSVTGSREQETATFFSETVPLTIRTSLATYGSLVLLAWYDPTLAGMCALMMVPALLLGVSYSRRLAALDSRRRRTAPVVMAHTAGNREARCPQSVWQIQDTDAQAIHVGLIRLFALGALALVLVRAASDRLLPAGDLFAIVGSTLLFISGLGELPSLLRQWYRPTQTLTR